MKTIKNEAFGAKLRETRKRLGLSQRRVGEILGVHGNTIKNWENGNTIPDTKLPAVVDFISGKLTDISDGTPEPDTDAAQPKKGDVPFYDVDFAASYLDYYNDERQPAIDHYVNIPQADGASMVCRASGESMAPTIPNGSHVILSEVTDFRWLDYGEIYALVASNGLRTIKRIRKNEDESKLTLVPDNPDYDINEIDKQDVLRLFRVVGTIQFATP